MNIVDIAQLKGLNFKLPVPYSQNSKTSLIFINTPDRCTHASWDIGNGRVLSFEYSRYTLECMYSIYESHKEYKESIYNIEWIQRYIPFDSEFKNQELIEDLDNSEPPF